MTLCGIFIDSSVEIMGGDVRERCRDNEADWGELIEESGRGACKAGRLGSKVRYGGCVLWVFGELEYLRLSCRHGSLATACHTWFIVDDARRPRCRRPVAPIHLHTLRFALQGLQGGFRVMFQVSR